MGLDSSKKHYVINSYAYTQNIKKYNLMISIITIIVLNIPIILCNKYKKKTLC